MESSSESPPGGLGRQVCRQGRDGLCIVAGVVGELDRDGLGGSLWDGSIELLYGSLRLNSLVKTDEADSFRKAWNRTLLGAACK